MMLTSICQRWAHGRDRYRPAREPIDNKRYDVAEIAGEGSDNLCRAFVEKHHYLGSYPAARRRFGLFRDASDLVGVAVFSMPWQRSLDRIRSPWTNRETLELSRFVLLDEVEGNAETWFLARCFGELCKEGFMSVLSYADPEPRRDATGVLVFPGHVGTIYQAHNATYLGRASARVQHVFADGHVLSDRDQSKIRRKERGVDYAVGLLVDRGAEPPATTDLAAWLSVWRPRITTPFRHGGNHTYLWALGKRQKRHLPSGVEYPKWSA